MVKQNTALIQYCSDTQGQCFITRIITFKNAIAFLKDLASVVILYEVIYEIILRQV